MMSQFFWQHMSSHIGKYVSTCEHHRINTRYNSSARGIPRPHTIPSRRFDVISVDLLSGFPTTKNVYDSLWPLPTDQLNVETHLLRLFILVGTGIRLTLTSSFVFIAIKKNCDQSSRLHSLKKFSPHPFRWFIWFGNPPTVWAMDDLLIS